MNEALTIRGMESAFFTMAGDNKLATRIPSGLAEKGFNKISNQMSKFQFSQWVLLSSVTQQPTMLEQFTAMFEFMTCLKTGVFFIFMLDCHV